MSTHTPIPPYSTETGGGAPRRRRGRRLIAVVATVAVIVVGGIGVFAWLSAQQPSCEKAADPTRAGAITEYCPSGLEGPRFSAMTRGADGNLWYTDQNNKITRFNVKTGTTTEFNAPASTYLVADDGLVSGGDGSLWYHANSKLWRMTLSGQNTEIQLPSDLPSAGIPIAGLDGAIWLPAFAANAAAEQQPGLLWIPTKGSGALAPVRVLSQLPAGVNAGDMIGGIDGNLWAPTPGGVVRITPTGVITRFTLNTTGGVSLLAAAPDGMLWFVDESNHVGRITPTGTATYLPNADIGKAPSNATNYGAAGAVIGPDGSLWFCNQQGMIGRVTTSGVVTKYTLPHNGTEIQVSQITAGSDGGVWLLTSFWDTLHRPWTHLVRVTA